MRYILLTEPTQRDISKSNFRAVCFLSYSSFQVKWLCRVFHLRHISERKENTQWDISKSNYCRPNSLGLLKLVEHSSDFRAVSLQEATLVFRENGIVISLLTSYRAERKQTVGYLQNQLLQTKFFWTFEVRRALK